MFDSEEDRNFKASDMEYERIYKPQNGIISPSKLRMKMIGAQLRRQKEGSNGNSSGTSPSKVEDAEFVKSSLLTTDSGDFGEEVKLSTNTLLPAAQDDLSSCQPKELTLRVDRDADHVKLQRFAKDDGCSFGSVQPIRSIEDENLDYDSTSSFEFHKGERLLQQHVTRSFSRTIPSKWNDAEKWILSRPSVQGNYPKKPYLQNQANRACVTSCARDAPESSGFESKLSVKRVDFCQPELPVGHHKFAFVPSGCDSISRQGNAAHAVNDLCPESKDLMEVDYRFPSCAKGSMQDITGTSAIRSVSMRDMGTEMTPIPSQEPSRTATPLEATTPTRSPTSSIPSTPRRGEPAPTPTPTNQFMGNASENGKKELSEEELKLKTRREIVALGVELGKMNIAAWASKEEKEKNTPAGGTDQDELEQIEYVKRAAAWEEAEKSKHAARFKREEIRIQGWENQQKAKLEAEMRRIEVQVEQMKAQAQAKMVKKIAMARQKSEEMRAAAEARRNRKAEKVAAQVEHIRQTGRIPSSFPCCCG